MLLRCCSAPVLSALASAHVALRRRDIALVTHTARRWHSNNGNNGNNGNGNNNTCHDADVRTVEATVTPAGCAAAVAAAKDAAGAADSSRATHTHAHAHAPLPSQTPAAAPTAHADGAQAPSPVLSAEDVALIVKALRNEPEDAAQAVMGGPGVGTRSGDMLAAFTCGRCEHRTVKRFSKHAYTKGIVIVECPSCHVKHLLADHLGWLENRSWTIEDFLRERREQCVHIGGGDFVVNASAEDMATPPSPPSP